MSIKQLEENKKHFFSINVFPAYLSQQQRTSEDLRKAIEENTSLETVYITYSNKEAPYGDARFVLAACFNGLIKNNTVKSLILQIKNFGITFERFLVMIAENKSLKMLEIVGSNMIGQKLRRFQQALALSSIEKLALMDIENYFEDQEYLGYIMEKVEYLTLRLDYLQIESINESLKRSKTLKRIELITYMEIEIGLLDLEENDTLEEFYISRCRVGSPNFFEKLKDNKALLNLGMINVTISDEIFPSIAEFLRTNTTLYSLHIGYLNFNPETSIEYLKQVFRALADNQTLGEFRLRHITEINADMMVEIVRTLKTNQFLTEFSIETLQPTPIPPTEAVSYIADIISNNHVLKKLIFGIEVRGDDMACNILLSALENNESLVYLSIGEDYSPEHELGERIDELINRNQDNYQRRNATLFELLLNNM